MRFWHVWIKGETLHLILPYLPSCQVVIDCMSGTQLIIVDAKDFDSPVFRWLGVAQHPSRKSILAVEGRYDGSPCRVKLVELSDVQNPKSLNYIHDCYSEFDGWISDGTLRFVRNLEVRSRDNKRLNEMTDEEYTMHVRNGESTYDIDEIFDVDVSMVLESTWQTEDADPIAIKVTEQ